MCCPASQDSCPDLAKAEHDVTVLAATGDYQASRLSPGAWAAGRRPGVRAGRQALGAGLSSNGARFRSADNRGRSAFNLKLVHNRHWLDSHGGEWRNFCAWARRPPWAVSGTARWISAARWHERLCGGVGFGAAAHGVFASLIRMSPRQPTSIAQRRRGAGSQSQLA